LALIHPPSGRLLGPSPSLLFPSPVLPFSSVDECAKAWLFSPLIFSWFSDSWIWAKRIFFRFFAWLLPCSLFFLPSSSPSFSHFSQSTNVRKLCSFHPYFPRGSQTLGSGPNAFFRIFKVVSLFPVVLRVVVIQSMVGTRGNQLRCSLNGFSIFFRWNEPSYSDLTVAFLRFPTFSCGSPSRGDSVDGCVKAWLLSPLFFPWFSNSLF
jgi:hypothetical protein